MQAIAIEEPFTRESVRLDPEYMYLFTDNKNRTSGNNPIDPHSLYAELYGASCKYPNKTQAVIRGLSNAYPITTMLDQYTHQWHDRYIDMYKHLLDFEISNIKRMEPLYSGLKYSAFMPFGMGTISKMSTAAPRCFDYLNKKLLEIGIKNV